MIWCSTYQDPAKLTSRLKGYVNKVAEFEGANLGDIKILFSQIKVRGLDLAIPHLGNPLQQQVLQEIAAYATSRNVLFNIFVIP